MKLPEPETISKMVGALFIGFLFFYLINSTIIFGDNYLEKQTSTIEEIIDKALVQCYALEGGYPSDVEYVEKYGVIFDHDKYVYYYEWVGSNLKPTIVVIEK